MTNGGSETVPPNQVTIDDLVIAPQASLPPVTQLDDDSQGRRIVICITFCPSHFMFHTKFFLSYDWNTCRYHTKIKIPKD